MDAEVKALWAAALRSGQYTQGFGALYEGGKWCCLGVLCDLAHEAGVLGDYEMDTYVKGPAALVTLPAKVADWLGSEYADPELIDVVNPELIDVVNGEVPEPIQATVLNDDAKYTFRQIADCIEATP